jgi:hypothetical protein
VYQTSRLRAVAERLVAIGELFVPRSHDSGEREDCGGRHLGYGNGRITRPATNQSKVGWTVYPDVAPYCGNFGLARAAAGGPG